MAVCAVVVNLVSGLIVGQVKVASGGEGMLVFTRPEETSAFGALTVQGDGYAYWDARDLQAKMQLCTLPNCNPVASFRHAGASLQLGGQGYMGAVTFSYGEKPCLLVLVATDFEITQEFVTDNTGRLLT